MPVLPDPREEAFAQHVVSGATGTKAAQLAGFSAKSARSQASRLLKRSNIVARVNELKQQVSASEIVQAVAVDQAYVIEKLRTVAERCMQTSMVVDRKGFPVVIEGPDGKPAIAYTFDSTGANKALHSLGLATGLFSEKKSEPPTPLKDLTDEQLEQLITRITSELSPAELAAFGLKRTGSAEASEQAGAVSTVPKAG